MLSFNLISRCVRTCFYYPSSYSLHSFFFFFFNDTATTEIYTLSLHDALPIWFHIDGTQPLHQLSKIDNFFAHAQKLDRKSTRLNSSHANISYAVFCLKKKKKIIITKV